MYTCWFTFAGGFGHETMLEQDQLPSFFYFSCSPLCCVQRTCMATCLLERKFSTPTAWLRMLCGWEGKWDVYMFTMSGSGSRSGVWAAGPGSRPRYERQGQSTSEWRQQGILSPERWQPGIRVHHLQYRGFFRRGTFWALHVCLIKLSCIKDVL